MPSRHISRLPWRNRRAPQICGCALADGGLRSSVVGDPPQPDTAQHPSPAWVGGRPSSAGGSVRWREQKRRWELRMQVGGVRHSEYFSVARYGSRERAFTEARRRQRILSGQAAAGLLVFRVDVPIEEFVERYL